jgi:hypothetical protein
VAGYSSSAERNLEHVLCSVRSNDRSFDLDHVGLMYLNTFALDHIWCSETRTWMALLMGAVMAAVMLVFMWNMYESGTAKFQSKTKRVRCCGFSPQCAPTSIQ